MHFRLKSLYEYKYEHLCACDVEKDMLLCPIIFLCFCVPQLLYDYFEVDGIMSFFILVRVLLVFIFQVD